MSSLRVESPRLCWIEAFVAVAETENISGAAKEMGLTQPTVSRYLQHLEHWLGKDLIKVGGVHDPDDPRVSVALTEDGIQFYPIAEKAISSLVDFRTMEARSEELRSAMASMLRKMRGDLYSKTPSRTAKRWSEVIDWHANLLANLKRGLALDHLITLNRKMRSDFASYETEKKREPRMKPRRRKGKIDVASLKL